MAELIKYFYGTEVQILGLTNVSPNWVEKAFYYPSDKTYFYQLVNGVMKKYGDVSGVLSGTGITINGQIMGGVKYKILENNVVDIPENYEYNVVSYLENNGVINNNGKINVL